MASNAQANRDKVEVRTPATLLLAGEPGTENKNLHFFQKAFTGSFQVCFRTLEAMNYSRKSQNSLM
jgi:hypothetical protein